MAVAVTIDGLPLGRILKAHRKQRRVTQSYVAERLGVNQGSVSRWETGHLAPQLDDLAKLAYLLDIEPAAISYGVHQWLIRGVEWLREADRFEESA